MRVKKREFAQLGRLGQTSTRVAYRSKRDDCTIHFFAPKLSSLSLIEG